MQKSAIKTINLSKISEQRIYLIRDQKVMLSSDLAPLYHVEVRALVQAVKRNITRFPKDFMFQLSEIEYRNLKSQIVISSWGGAHRSRPYAFTEEGIAMLSTVLKSKRAIDMSIAIMRVFVRLRQVLPVNQEFSLKLKELEGKYDKHDEDINAIFRALRKVIEERKESIPSTRRIGFNTTEK